MARSANNLTISISADSSKLRADMALAQSNVRAFAKEVKQAADEARKTGDTSRLREVSAQYETATRQVRGLNRALVEQNVAADAATGKLGKLGAALAAIDTRIGGIIGLSGGLKGAFAAFSVLEGTRAVVNKAADALQNFRDARNAALATTLPLNAVKAFNAAMTQAGIRGEKSAGALIQFGSAAGDAAAKWQAANKELSDSSGKFLAVGDAANNAAASVNVMRGSIGGGSGLVNVMRGGQKELDKTRDVFASIDIDIAKFVNSAGNLDVFKLWEASIKRINALMKAGDVRGARAGSLLLGEDDVVKLSKAVQILADNFARLNKEAENLPPTKGDLDRLDAYDAAAARLKTRWDNIFAGIAAASLENDRALAIGADRALTAFEAVAQKLLGILGELKTAFSELGTSFYTGFSTAFENIKTAATDLFTWLSEKTAALSSFLSSTVGQASGAPGGNLEGYATGGVVRGPGTGTSDSILARLSDGEYVVRARAVQHWGPQFLAALNAMRNPFGYAGGGLVSARRVPRFAEGGLVTATASDGTAVHLHLGGGSFALRGDRAIVESLTREARRAGMLSGGRLPGAAFA